MDLPWAGVEMMRCNIGKRGHQPPLRPWPRHHRTDPRSRAASPFEERSRARAVPTDPYRHGPLVENSSDRAGFHGQAVFYLIRTPEMKTKLLPMTPDFN